MDRTKRLTLCAHMHRVLHSITCSSMLRLVLLQCYMFNSNILYLPDIIREDITQLFQVGNVEQGNLINKYVKVQLEAVI